MAVGRTGTAGFDYIFATIPTTAASNTATQDYPVFVAPKACLVSSVMLVPATAATGTDTHSRNLNIDIPDGTEVANVDYVSGVDETAMTARTPYTAAAGTAMAAGGVLAVESELVSNGLILPHYLVRVKLQWK